MVLRADVVSHACARALWAAALVLAVWGLVVGAGRGYSAFDTRLALPQDAARKAAAQWDCVADTVDRLARADDALVLRSPDGDGYVQQRVVESVYPRVDLVATGGTGTLVVDYATSGMAGERCGDIVVRIDR